MADALLPWSNLTWNQFQRLTIHIAQQKYPGHFFEEYLKQGNDQEGIDIINSAVDSEGKYITLQCKHVVKLTKSVLAKIINDFSDGRFYESSSHFIIATTADLQKKDIQVALLDYKEAFHKRNIIFECWDKNLLEEQLKYHFTLVFESFGKTYADQHCFLRKTDFQWKENTVQVDYIPRSVGVYEAKQDYKWFTEWYYNSQHEYSLVDIFKSNRLSAKHICLVGDAHLGKTTLLKQVAFELEHIEVPYKCLFIELKSYNSQPIDKILDKQFRGWREIKALDLVIIIDGLDEVEASNFITSAKYINEFSLEHRVVNIIFSCRKLFFKQYELGKITSDFISYEVLSLGYKEINNYLSKKLGKNKAKFEQKVSISGVYTMIYHPFYLTNLVEKYIENPLKIPASKTQLVDLFVEESLVVSDTRNISGGSILKQVIIDFKKIVNRFAFALQLIDSNAIDDLHLQELFKRSEIELLQLSSLVVFYNGKWSFVNAIFQEHLAAFVLSKMEIEAIIDVISIGVKLRKIKAKWLQTTASLMAFLDNNDEKYKKLLDFIVSDNIEIVFTTEGSKFSDDQKLEFVQLLIERCDKYFMRPMLVDYRTIAAFIGNSSTVKDYLISVIGNKSALSISKPTFVNVLALLELTEQQKRSLYLSTKKALKGEINTYFIKEALEMCVVHKLGDKNFVTSLINNKSLNNSHEYRDGVYQLIWSLELTEEFYDYALDGMQYLFAYNKEISHGGSEFSIEEILFGTKSYDNIIKLLNKINDDEWLEYYRYSGDKSRVIRKIGTASAHIHSSNPLILLNLVQYIKTLANKHFDREYEGLGQFFELTNTSLIAFQLLSNLFADNSYWQFGYLITEDCIEHIVYLYEEGILTDEHILRIKGSLDYAGKTNLRDELTQLCEDVQGPVELKPIRELSEYEKREQIRLDNDLKYIKSKSAFRKGVIKYFEAYGRMSIPEDDIYVDPDLNPRRTETDSYFVYIFISHWVGSTDKRAYQKECLNILDKPNNFEIFRVEQLLHSYYKKEKFASIARPILEGYFNKNISKCDFENCIWDINEPDSRYTKRYRRFEVRIGHIFEEYGFEVDIEVLMNFIWLDDRGIRTLTDTSIDSQLSDEKKKSIAEMILERLSEQQMVLFREKIINNLKKGVKCDSVLGTHLSLCMHLKIYESVPLILELINNKETKDYNCYSYIDIYIELGGSKDSLVLLLESITDYNRHTYSRLIKLMHKTHAAIVKKTLCKCIADVESNEEIKVTAAKYLCDMGDVSGFDYLIEVLRKTRKAPHEPHGSIEINNVDTAYALKKLENYIHLLLTPKPVSVRFYDLPKGVILEWLYSFAKKSELDTELVYNYLLSFQEKFATKYENHYDLFWYAFRVIENYREHDGSKMTIEEAKDYIMTYS